MSKPTEEELTRIAQEIPRGSILCSPVHRCFPPQAKVCLICGRQSSVGCPFNPDKKEDTPVGNYLNLRGDIVHDGDVVT